MTILPCYRGRGSQADLVAYTQVSDDDADWLGGRRLCLSREGYAYAYCKSKKAMRPLHTVLLGDAPKGYVWDHIDQDRLNNNRENLRLATWSEIQLNRRVARSSKSGVTGVTRDSQGGWRVRHTRHGQLIDIGAFLESEFEIAVRACRISKAMLYGGHPYKLKVDRERIKHYARISAFMGGAVSGARRYLPEPSQGAA